MDLKTVIDTAPTLKSPVEPSRLNLNINLFSNASSQIHQWLRSQCNIRSMPICCINGFVSPDQCLCINTPSIPQTDFLPVMLHPTPVKQDAPPPPVPEKNAVAHIRIPLHKEQSSARDQMIEIDWPVESVTELLLLIQGLTQ